MFTIDKINQLAAILPSGSRLPENSKIHLLAFDENTCQLLNSDLNSKNHISFLILEADQTDLISQNKFKSLHCFIIKEVGVILSSFCSMASEQILSNHVKWAYYK